jgi:hypothetical protein
MDKIGALGEQLAKQLGISDDTIHEPKSLSASAIAAWDPIKGPNVKFARFVNNELTFFNDYTGEVEYIAVSHVWGDAEFRSIPHSGIKGQYKISKSKAEFVAQKLQGLVGETAFWMDTLTVNQRDQTEVISIVQAIPRIFRDAIKTLAIREYDGLYSCCEKELEGFKDWKDLSEKLIKHNDNNHQEHVREESYLQRLWTLQEILLSRTVEFVVSRPASQSEPPRHGSKALLDFYKTQADGQRLRDDLWVLSYIFCGPGPSERTEEFARAYVHGGTVTRDVEIERTDEEDIHTGSFRHILIASHRSATKHYDYVFAIMPQFPWYHFPVKAKDMSFGEIFCDLQRQASDSGHGFAGKITESMIDPKQVDQAAGWLSSLEQPEPECLGDFLKLLGERLPQSLPPGLSTPIHVTSPVIVIPIGDAAGHGAILRLIEASMKFCENTWRESHMGGELSKYGNFPKSTWNINVTDAAQAGWIVDPWKSKGRHMVMIEDGDDATIAVGPEVVYKECRPGIAEVQGAPGTDDPPPGYIPVLEQARMILDHMWSAHDSKIVNMAHKSDWTEFQRQMQTWWSGPLLQTMALLASMVSCQIGLSAAPWIRKHFVPSVVSFPGKQDTMILGLLAKHKRPEGRMAMYDGFCVSRHPGGPATGKDLTIVDPKTRVPVGIVPDFLHWDRTDEEYERKLHILYGGRIMVAGPGQVGFPVLGLDMFPTEL